MTPPAEEPLSLSALRVLAARGASIHAAALGDQPWLLFRAGAVSGAAEARRLADWLRQRPCPTLCIAGADASRALMRASDVVLKSPDDAAPLLANIRRAPLAAAVIVQLLRVTENLPVLDALYAESLAYATLQAGPEYRHWLNQYAPQPAGARDPGAAVEMARSGRELVVELNRPSRRNAISVEMRDALVEAFQLALADETITTVLLRGRGKCFSIGGDLDEFGRVPDPATGHAIRMLTLPARYLAQCADRVEAHVHSACIGAGAELPAFARRVIATANTFFQLPELEMGLLPGAGGTVSLPRRIGRQRAAWMMLSGKRVSAKTALEWGLVDAIV